MLLNKYFNLTQVISFDIWWLVDVLDMWYAVEIWENPIMHPICEWPYVPYSENDDYETVKVLLNCFVILQTIRLA